MGRDSLWIGESAEPSEVSICSDELQSLGPTRNVVKLSVVVDHDLRHVGARASWVSTRDVHAGGGRGTDFVERVLCNGQLVGFMFIHSSCS